MGTKRCTPCEKWGIEEKCYTDIWRGYIACCQSRLLVRFGICITLKIFDLILGKGPGWIQRDCLESPYRFREETSWKWRWWWFLCRTTGKNKMQKPKRKGKNEKHCYDICILTNFTMSQFLQKPKCKGKINWNEIKQKQILHKTIYFLWFLSERFSDSKIPHYSESHQRIQYFKLYFLLIVNTCLGTVHKHVRDGPDAKKRKKSARKNSARHPFSSTENRLQPHRKSLRSIFTGKFSMIFSAPPTPFSDPKSIKGNSFWHQPPYICFWTVP